jgi:hypothetical protein
MLRVIKNEMRFVLAITTISRFDTVKVAVKAG